VLKEKKPDRKTYSLSITTNNVFEDEKKEVTSQKKGPVQHPARRVGKRRKKVVLPSSTPTLEKGVLYEGRQAR